MLCSSFGKKYIETYRPLIRTLICRGAGDERYDIEYEEEVWYSDHIWSQIFGYRNESANRELLEFMDKVEEVTPMFKDRPRTPISPEREIAIDLHELFNIRSLEFSHDISLLLWQVIPDEIRDRYRRLAFHRHRIEFCKQVELHLTSFYRERGRTNVPIWRPLYPLCPRSSY